jgi:dihydroflavonol-4-reductase
LKALVTGSTGFIGSAITRHLVSDGVEVRVLVRDTSDTRNIDGLDVERVHGDIRDFDAVKAALNGCDTLYFTAAYFTHWAVDRKHFYDVNVGGTKASLRAALESGVEKVVYTSTNNAIGAYGPVATDEEAVFNYWKTSDHYSISKYLAEIEAFKFGARGLPIVIVNPTLVIGTHDIRPTSSGQLIIEVASGKLPVYMDGWVNLVDVEDVARGHILAAAKGRLGERYLLGNQNVTVGEYFQMIAEAAGISPPRLKAPYPVALAGAHLFELASRFTKKHPVATISEVKIGHLGETYDCSKAITELGLPQTPMRESIQRAVDWFKEHGYIPSSSNRTRSGRADR